LKEQPLIIAVSSPPGGGKSTLSAMLTEHYPDSSYINYDHYQQITEQPIEEVAYLLSDARNYDLLRVPELIDALQNIKAGRSIVEPLTGRMIPARGIVFFETPFGRAHSEMAQFIDYLVWIDVPLDIALARNFREFLNESFQSSSDLVSFNEWAKDYLNTYIEHVRPMLIDQKNIISKDADIVVDGSSTLDVMLSQVIEKYEGLSCK
jgi:uridine kinase